MMKRLLVLFGLVLLASCEKVIQLPLNEAGKQVVIEASLKDREGQSVIKITETGTVYDNEDFTKVGDALVEVKDSEGEVFVFEYQGAGEYKHADFTVVPGRGYELAVTRGENFFTSYSQVRTKPKIDSITYVNLSGTFGIPEDEVRYLVSFHSVDNAEEQNNYLLSMFRNGKKNNGYYLGNDDFINGQYYTASFFGINARPGDTVLVEMLSMDEAIYDFWIGLSGNIDDGPFSAAPANPPSNIEGGALGVFGVYTTDTLSVVIPS